MIALRIAAALFLLLVAAFCAVGFLATFEPPGALGWRIGYGTVGLLCIGMALWMLLGRRFRRSHSRGS